MSEIKRTLTFGGVALLLALLALLTAPRRVTPDAFADQGEAFFPDFEDPNVATTLEVIEFDEETAAARPFKVTFREGRWTIPSHHDYPADGKDRLAKTAAGVIGIRKDDFRSDNVSDHEACGVIDPLDEAVSTLEGRGKRVTLKGENDVVLADFIVGKKLEDRPELRFVRIPGQKRVYAARVDIELSTRFEDWIEKDLLQVERDDIQQVILEDYSINEVTRSVDQRDVVTLTRDGTGWKADKMRSSEEVDSGKMSSFLSSIDGLSIVGVRPKPAGLSQSLRREEGELAITQADLLSLQSKGYYFSRDGSLLSNEGELQVVTKTGVTYTLRFGEVLYGTGDAVTAGTPGSDEKESGPGENRYLFVTTHFDSRKLEPPPQPSNTVFQEKKEEEWSDSDRQNKQLQDAYDEWQRKVAEARKRSEELSARFADWYYVISSDSFEQLHLTRKDLVKKKES